MSTASRDDVWSQVLKPFWCICDHLVAADHCPTLWGNIELEVLPIGYHDECLGSYEWDQQLDEKVRWFTYNDISR